MLKCEEEGMSEEEETASSGLLESQTLQTSSGVPERQTPSDFIVIPDERQMSHQIESEKENQTESKYNQDDFRFGTDEEFEQWLEFSYSPMRPPFSPITPPPPPKNSKSNKLSSLQECIENLRQENGIVIPTTDHDWFEIDRADIMVRRSELVKDAVKEGRKKRFSPSKLINVTFVGEPAVDTGGPSREFWYLLVKGIAAQYCRGIDGKLTFERDIQALQLRTADNEESIAGTFQSEEVMGLLGETGYKKPPSFLERWEMCSSIKNYHTLTKVKAETDQFMEGLEALGVLQMIKDNEELMKVFFLPQKEKLTRDYFKTLLEPQFSSASSPYRAADEQAYIFFWDYLDECEDGAITVKQRIIQLGDILKFFTGADQQPVLGFNKPAILQFLHGEGEMYATSSTCDIILRLPTCHKEYTKFAEKITESLINEIYGHV
ncbi:uncharacterized protein [Dysidea avara]|uniref:uncharacterized protein n=1 Tax=Dysidea avara TaxID=196820 RepID=UPI003331E2DE